jgi:hypothetical protein
MTGWKALEAKRRKKQAKGFSPANEGPAIRSNRKKRPRVSQRLESLMNEVPVRSGDIAQPFQALQTIPSPSPRSAPPAVSITHRVVRVQVLS